MAEARARRDIAAMSRDAFLADLCDALGRILSGDRDLALVASLKNPIDRAMVATILRYLSVANSSKEDPEGVV